MTAMTRPTERRRRRNWTAPCRTSPTSRARRSDNADVGESDRLDLTQASWALEGSPRGSGDDPTRIAARSRSPPLGVTLREHLMQQLAGARCTNRDHALLHLLIEELEEDGYLRTDLEELASALPEELDLDPDELRTALRLLHSFDPPGVGARSVAECLMLQLPQVSQRLAVEPGDRGARRPDRPRPPGTAGWRGSSASCASCCAATKSSCAMPSA